MSGDASASAGAVATPPASEVISETLACAEHPAYFLDRHVSIYDATLGRWIPFRLWPAQAGVLDTIHGHRLSVILKARQLGLTWLVLGYARWLMVFRPAATVLVFSKREEESVYLLGDERLRGMYDRLPTWLKVASAEPDAARTWALANGSVLRAFPTNAGDSYTATLAVVDEADLVPDLDRLMRSVKPTIDGGGQMVLLSRSDKGKPQSEFKRIYRAARQGPSAWQGVFLPWHARPDRDRAWYEGQQADILHRTGWLDELHEQYPATDTEALAPRSQDKRIAPAWLHQCYQELRPLAPLPLGAPSIPGLEVYALPQPGRCYVIGADPAEGNPTSDASALTVLEADSGEEAAALAGQFQPAVLAAHADAIGHWYNKAEVLVERNNHGHAVLLWLRDHSRLRRLPGEDGNDGWLSHSRGKALLYDQAADAFREGDTVLHSFATFTQLASIEGASLRAPEGEADDRADSYALACVARNRPKKQTFWMLC
jgi:hypothetical protein